MLVPHEYTQFNHRNIRNEKLFRWISKVKFHVFRLSKAARKNAQYKWDWMQNRIKCLIEMVWYELFDKFQSKANEIYPNTTAAFIHIIVTFHVFDSNELELLFRWKISHCVRVNWMEWPALLHSRRPFYWQHVFIAFLLTYFTCRVVYFIRIHWIKGYYLATRIGH